MKSIKRKDLIKLLQRYNVQFVRKGKGSHEIYKRDSLSASIPAHREVSAGVLRNICQDLNINYKELSL